jgi:hypothetical protein
MQTSENVIAADEMSAARQKIRQETAPEWVQPMTIDYQFKSPKTTPVTQLLSSVQIHAERRENYIHYALRLETMEAVQHHSQWRFEFEPKTQTVTLHQLQIVRDGQPINHLDLAKARYLQREESLEKFVIHGWYTLLLILEDVRPGDVLECAYTIQTAPRFLTNNSSYFYGLPVNQAIGKYYFTVRFLPARTMRWKSVAPEFKPVETQVGELNHWEWSGQVTEVGELEVNTPCWHIATHWLQVSDLPDWQTVSTALAELWHAEAADDDISEVVREITASNAELPDRIESAIRLVQDECRYLSVNLELGGHIPTAPSVVLRRRYGDCKDLSFLLVRILQALGVTSARPLLVNSFLRQTIGELLPSPTLFNHAIVEFEVDGQRRWVDTTLHNQGGGPYNRNIPNFALGLPLETEGAQLVAAPKLTDVVNAYELREHLLLDTTGQPSLLAVTLVTSGVQADLFRAQFKQVGAEEIAKQREQSIANRYHKAKRTGTLKHQDERGENRFVMVETFEVTPLLAPHPNENMCRVQMPTSWVAGVLLLPPKTPRTRPFALPNPCQVHYTFDVDTSAIQSIKIEHPVQEYNEPPVEFKRTAKGGRGYFVATLKLNIREDFIAADRVQKFGQLVENIGNVANRELYILRGHSRNRPRAGFGELPAKIILQSTAKVEVPDDRVQPPPLKSSEHRRVHRQPTPPTGEISPRVKWWIVWIIVFILLRLLMTAMK